MLCKYSPCSHCFSVCLTDSAIRKLSGKVNHPEGQSHNHSQGQQHLFRKPGDISVCPQCLSVRKAKKHQRGEGPVDEHRGRKTDSWKQQRKILLESELCRSYMRERKTLFQNKPLLALRDQPSPPVGGYWMAPC